MEARTKGRIRKTTANNGKKNQTDQSEERWKLSEEAADGVRTSTRRITRIMKGRKRRGEEERLINRREKDKKDCRRKKSEIG